MSLDPLSFAERLERVAAWIAAYRQGVAQLPVVPHAEPGALLASLPTTPPENPEPFERILADFEGCIIPGITHWSHPRFFAYFPANTSEPSILAEMITAALGAQCMSWQTSPAATELEQRMLVWLAHLMSLPTTFTGVIQDTASSATLVAMLMARERATGHRFRELGAAAPGADRLRVYASMEAHSSVDKAVFLAGFGSANLRKIPVDEAYAMRPELLLRAIESDRAAGAIPAAVVATIGTTSSTGIDPLTAIGRICHEHDVFLHVDAAYAGSTAMLPECRPWFDGLEFADSYAFNPHKWLFTNFDCCAHYVRDVASLLATCAIQPEYLKTTHDARVVNFRDWGIPLGRRFRALKLWFVLRSFGASGLRAAVREHLRLGYLLRDLLMRAPGFQIVAPSPLALVCFRHVPAGIETSLVDSHNERLLAAVNRSGAAYLSPTRLSGAYVLRAHTAQERTTEADVRALVECLIQEAERLQSASDGLLD